MRWQSILDGGLAERGWTVIDDVAAALRRTRREIGPDAGSYAARVLRSPVLSHGSSGPALFFAYLDQARPGRGHDEAAIDFLELAIEQTSRGEIPLRLFEGFLSPAWTAQHLAGRIFESDDDDINAEIDEIVRGVVVKGGAGQAYDLLTGLVGWGVYAIERLPRRAAREILEAVVGELEAKAERQAPGLTWFTPPDPRVRIGGEIPKGHYNLGVAHGVPGVIGFLSELAERGIERRRVLPLVEGAVEWLLELELEDHEASFFCDRLVPGSPLYPTRTGWCYGDPGIVVVLIRAARAAGRPDWEEKALDIARQVAVRPIEKTLVIDAGLCHGAAGVAHMMNRLHQATGEPLFRETAVRWFRTCWEMRRPGQGYAGYAMWSHTDGQDVWRDDPGFLNGAAGIGLAWLAALSEVEPTWDRVMLLSLPSRSSSTGLEHFPPA